MLPAASDFIECIQRASFSGEDVLGCAVVLTGARSSQIFLGGADRGHYPLQMTVEDAAAKLLAGQDATTEIAIAKLVTSEANVKTALDAVQIFGATGYTTATGLEAGLRDAVGGTIYSGTSEIQRNRIAATLGLR